MTTNVTIKEHNPKYNTVWRFYIIFDGGGVICQQGTSKYADINFNIYYEDTCWGSKDQIEGYFLNNFIMPYLNNKKAIKTDTEQLVWPIKN